MNMNGEIRFCSENLYARNSRKCARIWRESSLVKGVRVVRARSPLTPPRTFRLPTAEATSRARFTLQAKSRLTPFSH